ncbi:DUF2278 family protein [Verrucomicrobium sp. BvORR106]|uniref:DUF2278 family protein n=1 Tax=Verrucomicrobium sp. BvORR106 TaxID=1403819 RepID=UPI00056F7795|nr:DUF2278 family protein [Verrucomicrobium sp. BvORR106]
MPVPNYGVLKARPVDRRLGAGQNPHYQIRAVAGNDDYRLAINVKSRQSPSELLFIVDEHFQHPVTEILTTLPGDGFHPLEHTPASGALDFIRGNLFDPMAMVPLPHDVPGPDNDLNEKFDGIIQRALSDETAVIYAFGSSWRPDNRPDPYFGFRPNRGIHEIHMNQGNDPEGDFADANGPYNDGGIIVHFPEQQQWVAVFTAFQSQAWHTNDQTGEPLEGSAPGQPGTDPRPPFPTDGDLPTTDVPDGLVRIVGALVNTIESPEKETVTLINRSTAEIDLSGWALADKNKEKTPLSGKLPAGGVFVAPVRSPMALSNKGGLITLLDADGRKIHGVSYTREQARHVGWTITF